MFAPVKLGVLALSLLLVSGLAGCTDQEAENELSLLRNVPLLPKSELPLPKKNPHA